MSTDALLAPTICPSCHRQELYISPRDARVGQCFACGLPRRIEADSDVVADTFQRLFEHTHMALTNTAEGAEVLESLMSCGIDLDTVLHSAVGVLSGDFDVDSFFAETIEAAKSKLEWLQSKQKMASQREAARIEIEIRVAESQLRQLRRIAKTTREAAKQLPGGLVCFYSDEFHNSRAGNVLRPFERDGFGVWIEPDKRGRRGVFNHGLFNPALAGGVVPDADTLLLLDDPISVLQVQSAYQREARATGGSGPYGYRWVAASPETNESAVIQAITGTPVVCYSPTAQGRSHLKALREAVTMTAFPAPADATLGNWLIERGDERGLADLRTQITEATLLTRPFPAVRSQIDRVRESNLMKKFKVDRMASEVVARDLGERGRLFHDDRLGYVLLIDTKTVVPFDVDNAEFRLLLAKYGVGEKDSLFKPLVAFLDVAARTKGKKAQVHRLSYFDAEQSTVYVFNYEQTVYRITSQGVTAVENGTDGVLFVADSTHEPWTLLPDVSGVGLAETLLGGIRLAKSALSDFGVKFLIVVWFYSLFFRELFPTRVILALVGQKGSGKTTLLKRKGRLLFGSKFEPTDISNDPKDLDAAITSQPFVVIDNADRPIPWLDDKLAVAATGGSVKRRVLYTTNRLVEFPIVASLGITSRTPHFRREDVADRLLIINVERFEKFVSANQLDSDIERNRDALMTEVVFNLQQIVAELERQKDVHVPTTFRMADFAEFAIKIGLVFGARPEEVEQILNDLTDVQLEFTSEDEPLLLHIDGWLGDAKNIGKWVSTKELFEQLHVQWTIRHAHSPGAIRGSWGSRSRAFELRWRRTTTLTSRRNTLALATCASTSGGPKVTWPRTS